eukprot:284290-Chlamydomonas_euryale.AAC.3
MAGRVSEGSRHAGGGPLGFVGKHQMCAVEVIKGFVGKHQMCAVAVIKGFVGKHRMCAVEVIKGFVGKHRTCAVKVWRFDGVRQGTPTRVRLMM